MSAEEDKTGFTDHQAHGPERAQGCQTQAVVPPARCPGPGTLPQEALGSLLQTPVRVN